MDEKKKVNIGLDIGIASVGWAVVAADEFEIIDAGSRLFSEANNSKKASDRRTVRGRRRILRRRNQRSADFKKLLVDYKYLNNIDDFSKIIINNNENMYWLRLKGLKEELTKDEFVLVLFNLLKHRGTFYWKEQNLKKEKETRKNDSREAIYQQVENYVNKEDLNLSDYSFVKNLKIRGLENIVGHKAFLTEINSLFSWQKSFFEIDENFINDYIDLFNRKREYYEGPSFSYGSNNTFSWQKPGMTTIEKEKAFYDLLAGKDSYDRSQIRMPAEGVYANIYNLLNELNNLDIGGDGDRKFNGNCNTEWKNKLSFYEKTLLLQFIFGSFDPRVFPDKYGKKKDEYLGSINNLTPPRLREILNINKDIPIGGFMKNGKGEDIIATEFSSLKQIMKKLRTNNLDSSWIKYDSHDSKGIAFLDELVTVMTIYKSEESRYEMIKELFERSDIEENEQIKTLAFLDEDKNEEAFSGTHSLSKATLFKRNDAGETILDELLKTSKNFSKISKERGMKLDFDFEMENQNLDFIPIMKKEIDSMFISPVVKRSLIQTLKVLREIQKEFGEEYEIQNVAIELATENSSADKKEIYKIKQKIAEKIKSQINKSTDDILGSKNWRKERLWFEQHYKCAYCRKDVNKDELEECDLDHIVPKSILPVDAMHNQVLAHKSCNYSKGARTPFQWKNGTPDWEKYRLFIEEELYKDYFKFIEDKIAKRPPANKSDQWSDFQKLANLTWKRQDAYINKKKKNLTSERVLVDKYKTGFIERNLADTRYAARIIEKYINDYVALTNKFKVSTTNGAVTSYIKRQFFSLKEKKNRDDYKHHAIDAVAIACSNEINNFFKKSWRDKDLDELKERFNKTALIKKFFDDTNSCRFSYMPQHDSNQRLTDDGIVSYRKIDSEADGYRRVEKVDLSTDDAKTIKIIHEFFDDDETTAKPLLKYSDDQETWRYLVSIYHSNNDDKNKNPFKIFVENKGNDGELSEQQEIRKITKNGKPGNSIKQLKYYSTKLKRKGELKILEIGQKYTDKPHNKIVGKISFSTFRVDFYKEDKEDGGFIMRQVNINTIKQQTVNMNKFDINKFEPKQIPDYTFYASFFLHDVVEITKRDRITKSISKKTYILSRLPSEKQLVFKYLHKTTHGNEGLTSAPSVMIDIKKVNLSPLGRKFSLDELE